MRAHAAAAVFAAFVLTGCPRTPYHCSTSSCDPSTRAICTLETEPQCAVPNSRCDSGYAYSRSAAHPGVCVTASAIGSDASVDAVFDANDDATEAGDADDSGDTGGTPDTSQWQCPAPQLIAPLSGSRGTSNIPHLVLQIGAGAGTGTIEVEFAPTRTGFDVPERTVSFGAMMPRSTTDITSALAPGVHFWRARMHCDRESSTSDWSQIWWMLLPHRESSGGTAFKAYPGPLDPNGDGVFDFVLGTPGAMQWGINVYSSPTDGSGTITRTRYARADLMSFGASVANVGDVNGDGYSDLVVGGCPPFEVVSATLQCNHTLWFMPGNPSSAMPPMFSAPLPITRPNGADGAPVTGSYGGPVAGVGDVDGDGYGDFVAGSGTSGGRQSIFVFRGSPTGPLENPLRIDPPTSSTGFGRSVAGVGDLLSTGRGVVLVGGDNDAFVISFAPDPGGNPMPTATPITPSGTRDFGAQVSAGGDRNGDGSLEFLVADPVAGSVHEYGAPAVHLSQWTSTETGDEAGLAISAADWNGDGLDDYLAGAPLSANSFGTLYVIEGSGSTTSETTPSPLFVAHNYGRAAAFVGPSSMGDYCMVVGAPDLGTGTPGNTQGGAFYRCHGTGSSFDVPLASGLSPGAGAAFGLAISQ